jgi:hypothetical protein
MTAQPASLGALKALLFGSCYSPNTASVVLRQYADCNLGPGPYADVLAGFRGVSEVTEALPMTTVSTRDIL